MRNKALDGAVDETRASNFLFRFSLFHETTTVLTLIHHSFFFQVTPSEFILQPSFLNIAIPIPCCPLTTLQRRPRNYGTTPEGKIDCIILPPVHPLVLTDLFAPTSLLPIHILSLAPIVSRASHII